MSYINKFILGFCKIDKNYICTRKLTKRGDGSYVSDIYQNHDGHESEFGHIAAGIYLLKVNNRNTGARCEICSRIIITTPERRQ